MQNARLAPYRTLYGPDVSEVIGIEPSPKLLAMARAAGRSAARPLELVEGSAEAVPIETASIDTVVTTWTMCSIPNVEAALAEMRRRVALGGLNELHSPAAKRLGHRRYYAPAGGGTPNCRTRARRK